MPDYANIPAIVLLVCLYETYRYLRSHYLGGWYTDSEGITRRRSVWWFTAQDKHIRLLARFIACPCALLSGVLVWLKLGAGEANLSRLLFSAWWWAFMALGISAATAILVGIVKRRNENLDLLISSADLALLSIAATLPFFANALLFAFAHAMA